MRNFLQALAANLLAILITLFVAGMVCFVVGVAMVATVMSGHHETTAKAGSVLVFDMDRDITDAPSRSASASDILSGGSDSMSLHDVLDAINAAAKDKNIVALYLQGSLSDGDSIEGYGALREIRQAVIRFQATGKPVYAYLIEPSIKDYYLASAAKELDINPFGMVSLNGIAADSMFLGKALKDYGVGVQVTKVGKYKSATEIFTNDSMSDADREQLTQLLGGIWDDVLTDISASRKIDLVQLRKIADQPGIFMAQDAIKNKLADHATYFDEILEKLNKVAKYDTANDTFQQITVNDYSKHLTSSNATRTSSKTGDHIAVLYIDGEIVDGNGGTSDVGGDTIASYLRQLRDDDDVKALVLRVNSPGGSALASEIIQREVRLFKATQKPVIVSFGSVAASGGYWISAYGDYIFAEPSTITGSIGVFGLKFNVQDIANQHGLSFDDVKTAPFADLDSMTKPWSPEEVVLAQTQVDYLYDQFITKVSDGRRLPLDHVRDIAQGRVWSGKAAKDIGLVDGLGGLQDAITLAEQRAKLSGKSWTLQEYPEKRSPAQVLIDSVTGGNKDEPLSKVAASAATTTLSSGNDPLSVSIRAFQAKLHVLHTFNDPKCVYARLPYLIQF